MMEVVKVQLRATADGVRAVIYPRDCACKLISIGGKYPDKRIKQQKLDATTRRALNGERNGYFKASWLGRNWQIGRRLPDQGW